MPTLEPICINDLEENDIIKQVEEMTFPVLIKASAGGGGRGMKKIEKDDDLIAAIEILKEESRLAFGDDTLFIEKYISNPRHIEIHPGQEL